MPNKGYKQKEEHKIKISEGLKLAYVNGRNSNVPKGEEHYEWKAEEVGYRALHIWVRKNKIPSVACEECNKIGLLDIANISGEYKRDVNDYKWLCRSCHKKRDLRRIKLST